MSRERGAGKEVWSAECLCDLYGLHPRVRCEQGRLACGRQLHELPRIARHAESQGREERNLQGEHSEYLWNLSRRSEGRVFCRRAWEGRRKRKPEGAGMYGLPYCSRDPAADDGELPYEVHADLRLVPQGAACDISGHVPLAAWAARRLCGDGALLGLPWSARHFAGIGSQLPDCARQPHKDMRKVP